MTQTTIEHRVEQLRRAHLDVADGGYALQDALLHLRSRLEGSDREQFDDAMERLIATANLEMWGVALSVLAEVDPGTTGRRLARLHADATNQEIKDRLLLALLDQRSSDLSAPTPEVLKVLARRGGPQGLQFIGALAGVDQDQAVSLAARLFLSLDLSNRATCDAVLGYIPGLLDRLGSVDPQLVTSVIDQVAAADGGAAAKLRDLVSRVASEPFRRSELTMQRVRRALDAQ